MTDILNMPPHERLKMARKGEKVLCKKCKRGIMVPVGDREKTTTFHCSFCKNH